MWHLLHPAFVHFSIALLILGGSWEAWGQISRRDSAIRSGGVLTIVGTLSLLPTIVSGYLAANTVAVPEQARRVFDMHETNGWVVLGLFVALLFWKGWHRGRVSSSQSRLYGLALLLGVALVVFGATLGGELVYVYGVGVGVVP